MQEKKRENLTVVIPNWNGKDFLAPCLDSLLRQSVPCPPIIVVDNGSTDDSRAFLQKHYPRVQIVALPENLGFSAAINAGISHADTAWIFLLNNDTQLHPRCLETMNERCFRQNEYDMFALKMMSYHDRTMIDGAGDSVLRGGVGYRLGTGEYDKTPYAMRREVFGACAGAGLYRRSLFNKIGTFDEDFFAYLEDVDFNIRAKRAGVKCCYIPDAVVYHIGSATSGSTINPFTIRLSTRNNVFVIIKHVSVHLFVWFLPAFLVYQFFWLVFVIKKGHFSSYIAGIVESIRYLGAMIGKRKNIKSTSILSSRQLVRACIDAEREAIYSIMMRRRQHNRTNVLLHLYLRIFC
jgi:GT2 family glycosyltransferase